ncbi:MAG: hypothetical protein WC867_03820 [Candidatus Pacearchaeota archaeon]|jgi:hypothetical protein
MTTAIFYFSDIDFFLNYSLNSFKKSNPHINVIAIYYKKSISNNAINRDLEKVNSEIFIKNEFIEKKNLSYSFQDITFFYGKDLNNLYKDLYTLIKTNNFNELLIINGDYIYFQDNLENIFNNDFFIGNVTEKYYKNNHFIIGKKQYLLELLNSIIKKELIFFDNFSNGSIRITNLPKIYNLVLLDNANIIDLKNNHIFYNGKLAKVLNLMDIDKTSFLKNVILNRIEIKKDIQKLAGDFYGITTFFNPARYSNKLKNFRKFRKSTKKQGLKLIVVEAVFGNQKFQLKKDDAEIIIQLKATSILWQKERMINIGLSYIPNTCDKIAWLDCDILFMNDNWIKETSKLLEFYPIVQPFSESIRLKKNQKKFNFVSTPYAHRIDNDLLKIHSTGYRINEFGPEIMNFDMNFYGHCGYAWAARKNAILNGLFDRSISPNSDLFMTSIFALNKMNDDSKRFISEKSKIHLLKWQEGIPNIIKGSIGFTSGTVLHLWHGDQNKRGFMNYKNILDKYNFDPEKDIRIGKNNLFEWSSDKKVLHKEIYEFFIKRDEDKPLFDKISSFMKKF